MADTKAAAANPPPFSSFDNRRYAPRPYDVTPRPPLAYITALAPIDVGSPIPKDAPDRTHAIGALAQRWRVTCGGAAGAIDTAIARIRSGTVASVRVVDTWASVEIRWLECPRCGGSTASGSDGNERCRFCNERMRQRTRTTRRDAPSGESTRDSGMSRVGGPRPRGRMSMRGPGVLQANRR